MLRLRTRLDTVVLRANVELMAVYFSFNAFTQEYLVGRVSSLQLHTAAAVAARHLLDQQNNITVPHFHK